ncbi:MAG TPA: isochorismatase family cysteine hydrolase [Candidatus Binatia bacterium]|nr:isochorismatase family cysteine hydrolase [Candidatus Binatia bacterium]
MANLNLDRAKTALLSMDIQKATVRKSSMFRERHVGQAAKSVLEAARNAAILVVHVVIDYQPAFFSPRNKFLQKIRIPVLSAPGVDVAELLEIADEVKPVGDEPIVRKPRMNPFFGTALESMLRSRDIDTVVLMGVATEFVVESAVRHAADADFRVIVLEDCCASFSEEAHRVSLHIIDHLATLATAADFQQSI